MTKYHHPKKFFLLGLFSSALTTLSVRMDQEVSPAEKRASEHEQKVIYETITQRRVVETEIDRNLYK